MQRPLVVNLFCMDTPGHVTHGTWRHPASRSHEHNDLALWMELARLAERGKFDAIFFADVAGIYPKWRGSWDLIMRQAIQFPISDPMVLVSALASATEHLSFVVTNSVLQHPPFTFARTASTLDHLTRGRFGWNIVTSFTESASRNVGLPAATDHDARYRWADEFCTVVYKLWEDSWEDGALVVDKEGGVYADAAKVREIDHEGERYSVPGPHLLPPSPQRTPMLFQAGTSTAGREFAARNAEGIFMISSSPDAAAPVVKDVTARAVAAGRRAEDLHFIQGLTFIIGSTEAEARRKEAELEEYIDGEAQVANFAGTLGLDLATIDPGEPLVQLLERVPGIRGAVQRMIDTAPAGTTPTMQDLARHTGKYWRVTGTPEQIADRLQQWVDAGITGINVMSMITPGTYVDFVDHAVPELQRRRLMQREYRPGTLREKLYPGRGPFLADGHPARAPRRPTSIGAQA